MTWACKPRGVGDAGPKPRTAATTSRWRRTCSAAPLWPSVPMPCGWPTSPTFQPTRAFCPWPPKDLATRQIVGWSMAEHLKAGLCIDALVMALQGCRPPRGLIHHSDRGSQGGFKWSSQHLDGGSCDGEAEAEIGSVRAGAITVTRSATGGGTRGAATVLGSDRGRHGE